VLKATAILVYHVRHIVLFRKELFAHVWFTYGEDEKRQYLSKNESWLFIPLTV